MCCDATTHPTVTCSAPARGAANGGAYDCASVTPVGGTCKANCNVNYVGEPTVTCLASGQWSAAYNPCVAQGGILEGFCCNALLVAFALSAALKTKDDWAFV